MFVKIWLLSIAVALSLSGCATTIPDEVKSSPENYEYRLGEGDNIFIQVFDEPDLTMSARVGASGAINYSYLGDVKVAGKTPQELGAELQKLLSSGYLVNPAVNVTMESYRAFFMNGEIKSPGSYSYQPGLTVEKAIVLAGGVTDRASLNKIYIIRAGDDESSSEKAGPKTFINPGDVISIKEGFF